MVKAREWMDFVMRLVRKLRKAKAIMVNTFLELETHAIKSFSSDSRLPFVYPVGPLLNLEGGAGKPMGSFEEVQVKEIAYSLERSGHRFVWSLHRPPLEETTIGNPSDYEDPGVVLLEGFMERTAGIRKVIGWDMHKR
ncbi:hypothetical protein L6452_32813 [Arctium lappa]|uniref:Uncharacterized protein n=1 Tax=Arctium lappa TaxID=4217 RepID=A0ACB8Z5E1_ARCLA|nr:hypothetical protein L6452_32813 [Arctium lappa]